jgi:hypothetical protein
MITWTQVQSVDGKKVETRNTLTLGFLGWSAAWLAATGSFGSFVVNLGRALAWWR